ncbi:hypothetical protein ACGFYP_07740 [Streptomyces sp. NPDC048370]|uniref:hypothetical protein n=1 Tax=Streptomyces sp. NPDC048370 TaxID=3365540 RepID=UPI003713E247
MVGARGWRLARSPEREGALAGRTHGAPTLALALALVLTLTLALTLVLTLVLVLVLDYTGQGLYSRLSSRSTA